MSKTTISTLEDLKALVRKSVSEKRYLHCLGVAQTAYDVLEHYGLLNDVESWNGFDAALFCGVAHDIAREMDDASLLRYCEENHIHLPKEDIDSPVLAHGLVSAEIVMKHVGTIPMSWYKALCVHTTGNIGMDSLALAIFVADYIEPTRKFMTEEKRAYYLSAENLFLCAYRVLCDMMNHWSQTGFHSISSASIAMKEDLERKLAGDEK